MSIPVLSSDEPRELTAIGVGIVRCHLSPEGKLAVLAQLLVGPNLAAFEDGLLDDDYTVIDDGLDTIVVDVPC